MYFPSYSLKNFFNKPNEIVDFANSCKFEKDEIGIFPGKRTNCLSEINSDLFLFSCRKVLRMIYGPEVSSVNFQAKAYFQSINKEDINNELEGWAHIDPNPLTAIIYLSPSLTAGTSILEKKQEYYDIHKRQLEKENNYSGKDIGNNYFEEKTKVNNQYNTFITQNSLYNSLFAFDGGNPHKAHFNFLDNLDRLTLIIFFNKIYAPWYPMTEIDRF